MKLKELLELTKEKNLATLAKEGLLPCGEKKFRGYLKKIGCEPAGTGKSGWLYDKADSGELEKEVTELFIPRKKTSTAKSRQKENQKINKTEKKYSKNTENHDIMKSRKKESGENVIQETHPTNQIEIRQYEQPFAMETRKPVKKVTYEIDEDLHVEFRMVAFRQRKNVSELVEQAMREYLENRLK